MPMRRDFLRRDRQKDPDTEKRDAGGPTTRDFRAVQEAEDLACAGIAHRDDALQRRGAEPRIRRLHVDELVDGDVGRTRRHRQADALARERDTQPLRAVDQAFAVFDRRRGECVHQWPKGMAAAVGHGSR